MNNKKHIDRFFQENLKDLDVTPHGSVWDKIYTRLQNQRKNKKSVPLWLKITGVAAGLLLFFTIGSAILKTNNKAIIVNTDQNKAQKSIKKDNINPIEIPENSKSVVIESFPKENASNSIEEQNKYVKTENSSSIKTPFEISKKLVTANKINKKKRTLNTTIPNKLLETNEISTIAQKPINLKRDKITFASKENHISTNTKEQINSTIRGITNKDLNTDITNLDSKQEGVIQGVLDAKIDDEGKLSLTKTVLANTEESIESPNKEKHNKWNLAPNIAPVYFNAFGKGSSINSQFNNNSKTGNINMSYGITGSYAISEKLSVRVGINNVNLGYTTNDVMVLFNTVNPSRSNPQVFKNVVFNETSQNLSFNNVEEFNIVNIPKVYNDFINTSIDQKLGFIEVPLELEYNISNRTVDINIIGGFSTLFLSDNQIYSILNGNSTLLGKATNINNTSFSANFGLGFDFKISKLFNFNLEPVFKYQLNTFNNTSGNFNPYFIGVYTGFKFKF